MIYQIICCKCCTGRKKDDDTYEGTTWKINFKLDNANQTGSFVLRIALATANLAELQVYYIYIYLKKLETISHLNMEDALSIKIKIAACP